MDCRSIVQIAKLRASVSFLCAWCSCEANSDLRTPGQRRLSGDCVALKMGTSSDIRKKGKAQFLVSREDITPQSFMVANKPLGDIHHTSAAFLCRIFGYLDCWILSTGGSASSKINKARFRNYTAGTFILIANTTGAARIRAFS